MMTFKETWQNGKEDCWGVGEGGHVPVYPGTAASIIGSSGKQTEVKGDVLRKAEPANTGANLSTWTLVSSRSDLTAAL